MRIGVRGHDIGHYKLDKLAEIMEGKNLKSILDNVKSNNLQVIFDPINFIDESNYDKQDEIIKKSFELFGNRIVMIHAKDFIYEDGKVKQVSIGEGQLILICIVLSFLVWYI